MGIGDSVAEPPVGDLYDGVGVVVAEEVCVWMEVVPTNSGI